MDSDHLLLDRWCAGEQQAGEELFQRHFADILRFFDNKAWEKAEDLTQQTFLECVRSKGKFRRESSFRTYLFGIAWNQLRQHFRLQVKNDLLDFEVSSARELAAMSMSPSSAVDKGRRGVRLHQALRSLPLAQQTLLECHYWQDLDSAALAEILGVPTGTVRVRLLRARNALRQQLARLDERDAPSPDDPLSVSLRRLEDEDRADESSNTV